MGGAGKAIASVRRENGLSEHFQMPMPCTVDAIQKVADAMGFLKSKWRSGAIYGDINWLHTLKKLSIVGILYGIYSDINAYNLYEINIDQQDMGVWKWGV